MGCTNHIVGGVLAVLALGCIVVATLVIAVPRKGDCTCELSYGAYCCLDNPEDSPCGRDQCSCYEFSFEASGEATCLDKEKDLSDDNRKTLAIVLYSIGGVLLFLMGVVSCRDMLECTGCLDDSADTGGNSSTSCNSVYQTELTRTDG